MRSIWVAIAVTVICAVIALPMAFFMAKVASARTRHWLVIAILTPLWASYLVKAYAWRVMLANGGPIDSLLGGPGHGPGYGLTATIIVLSYLWLPYMILPVYAGLDRLPNSLLEASSDLGARSGRTFRSVVLPMVWPAVVAGSIFTFSLSLGDYIAVKIVGGKTQMIGNLVYDNSGAANNLPFCAALATIPVVIMVVYLIAVRRSGALEEL
jgi:putative spermidine/putrescine transport system permease protein